MGLTEAHKVADRGQAVDRATKQRRSVDSVDSVASDRGGGNEDDGGSSGGMRDRVASRQLPMSPSESAMNGAPEGELYEVTLLTSDKVH